MSKLNPLYTEMRCKEVFPKGTHQRKDGVIWEQQLAINIHTRLKKLKRAWEAIYTPSNTNMNRYNMKPKRWWVNSNPISTSYESDLFLFFR